MTAGNSSSRADRVAAASAQRQGLAVPDQPQGDLSPDQRWAPVRAQLIEQTNWFRSLLPSHMNDSSQVKQFLAMCFNVVKESDWQLQRALMEAPQTFFSAAAECAQLGLIPGKQYHFVAFNTTVKVPGERDRKEFQVTGITDYKGELDLIYRSGRVRAVHAEVVRAGDTFTYRKGMDFPHHVVHAPEPPEGYTQVQEGLGTDEERGPLTGVYAYAVLVDGGFSRVSVLNRSRIARLRSKKTEAFWGPAWPDEGPWTEDMWRKSAVHDLFDDVPHSVEYVIDQLRVRAAISDAPKGAALPAAPEPVVRALDGAPAPAAFREPGDEPPPPEPPRQSRAVSMRQINAIFGEHGLGGKKDQDTRRAVISALLTRPGDKVTLITSAAGLSDEQAVNVAVALAEAERRASAAGRDLEALLRETAEKAVQAAQPEPPDNGRVNQGDDAEWLKAGNRADVGPDPRDDMPAGEEPAE